MRFALRTIAAAAIVFAVAVPHLGAQRLQWENISGGMTSGVQGIHMLNGTYIAAGMNPGGVYITSDKGMTWAAVNNGLEDTHLTSFEYDHLTKVLYAATESGELFASDDFGAHWNFHSLMPDNATSIAVRDSNLYAYGPVGNVFTFANAWLPLYSKASDDHAATSFRRMNDGTLFVGTKAKGLYRSTDEGSTWMDVWPNSARVLAIYANPEHGVLYIDTEAGLRMSTDNGDTWTAFSRPGNDSPVLDLFAFDDVSVIAIEPETKQIYSTGDAGATWIPYPESPEFEKLFYTGNGYFIGAGSTSGISMTTDWGATWYTSMASMKAKEIPSVQSYGINPAETTLYMGGRYISSDGGMKWTRHPDMGMTDWRDSTVFGTLQIAHAGAWFLSAESDMYQSQDQGESWMPMYSLGTEIIVDYAFQQNIARDIVIITDAAILYYYDSQQMTSNAWNSPVVNPGLVFVTAEKNVIVGDADTRQLYFSSNQGESFTVLQGMSFIDGQKMYEYEPGVLLLGDRISNDGGATWTTRSLNAEVTVPEIYVITTDNRGLTYYGTANGLFVGWGLEESLRYEGLGAPVTVLTILPNGDIAASGPGLGIRRASADVLTGVEPVQQPTRIAVTSAPNPFTASTAISMTMERAGDMTLAVYNLLGARVATVAAGYHPAGAYTFQWNGRSDAGRQLPSGMYMLTLVSPNGVATRQLVKM